MTKEEIIAFRNSVEKLSKQLKKKGIKTISKERIINNRAKKYRKSRRPSDIYITYKAPIGYNFATLCLDGKNFIGCKQYFNIESGKVKYVPSRETKKFEQDKTIIRLEKRLNNEDLDNLIYSENELNQNLFSIYANHIYDYTGVEDLLVEKLIGELESHGKKVKTK